MTFRSIFLVVAFILPAVFLNGQSKRPATAQTATVAAVQDSTKRSFDIKKRKSR